MSQVNVTINGKSYRIACDDGQEQHLTGLAARLDGMIGDMRGAFGEIGDQRLTVMAALMVMDEASETERRLSAAEAELADLSEARETMAHRRVANEAALARHVNAIAERVEHLAAALSSRTSVG